MSASGCERRRAETCDHRPRPRRRSRPRELEDFPR